MKIINHYSESTSEIFFGLISILEDAPPRIQFLAPFWHNLTSLISFSTFKLINLNIFNFAQMHTGGLISIDQSQFKVFIIERQPWYRAVSTIKINQQFPTWIVKWFVRVLSWVLRCSPHLSRKSNYKNHSNLASLFIVNSSLYYLPSDFLSQTLPIGWHNFPIFHIH